MTAASVTSLLGPEAIERLHQPIENARALGSAAYASEAYFRLEQEKLFGRQWTGVAFGHQIPNPGDALPVTVAGGIPAIVLRDRDGEVRAFHNVCRHRGAVILTEPCQGRPTLRCPYHGWAYALDGALKATPLWDGKRVADPGSLDRSSRGLVPIRCAVWADVVFVDLSGEAPPIETVTAPFARLWAPYEMERFRLAHYETGEIPANWKLAMEAAVENYHEEFVHQELPARVDANGAKTFTEVTDGDMFGFTWAGDLSLRSTTPLVPLRSNRPEDERADSLCFLFPNTQLSLFGSLAVRTIWAPRAVDKTQWLTSWYLVDDAATDDAHADDRAEMVRYWRQLRGEDGKVLDLMQRGRRSPVADDIKLSPFWEGLILHFHQKLVDTMMAVSA